MTKKTLIPTVVTMSLLLSLLVFAQEHPSSGTTKPESHLELVEAAIAVKMHELELKRFELEANNATVETEKFKVRLEIAVERGNSHEVAFAKLDLKQAKIAVDMQTAQTEMARLRLNLAKVRLDHLGATLN